MKNLCAEMARFGVTEPDISILINCTERTVKNKLVGRSEFSVEDAIKIRDKFFPGMKIEYLFAPDMEPNKLFTKNKPADKVQPGA